LTTAPQAPGSLPTLKFAGQVITGAVLTVNVAADVVALPQELVKTAWYKFPFCDEIAVNVSGDAPLPVFVHVEPPFVLTCHWSEGVGVPLAEALKLAVPPAQTVSFPGLPVICGVVHEGVIVVIAVALLLPAFGSAVPEDAIAVFETVPLAPLLTFTTNPNGALPPEAKLVDLVQITLPVPPTDGVDAVHPDGVVAETNVVPEGIGSMRVSGLALPGPALLTVIEYVTLLPALTGFGLPVFVTDRSA
jgi:hypothetical protein